MPRHSDTGNVKKLCGCARGKRWSCSHPWYVDVKAPKDHATRSNERYRRNLDEPVEMACGPRNSMTIIALSAGSPA